MMYLLQLQACDALTSTFSITEQGIGGPAEMQW